MRLVLLGVLRPEDRVTELEVRMQAAENVVAFLVAEWSRQIAPKSPLQGIEALRAAMVAALMTHPPADPEAGRIGEAVEAILADAQGHLVRDA